MGHRNTAIGPQRSQATPHAEAAEHEESGTTHPRLLAGPAGTSGRGPPLRTTGLSLLLSAFPPLRRGKIGRSAHIPAPKGRPSIARGVSPCSSAPKGRPSIARG